MVIASYDAVDYGLGLIVHFSRQAVISTGTKGAEENITGLTTPVLWMQTSTRTVFLSGSRDGATHLRHGEQGTKVM